MTKAYRVQVTQWVNVTVDEEKFDETFMAEFRQSFYQFHSLTDHIEHIAQLEARSLLDDFTEGYGPISDFGISARVVDQEIEVEE